MNLLLSVSLLIIISIHHCLCISFVFGPSHVSTTVGQTVTFRCRVRNKGSFSVHWRNANQQLYLTADTNFYPTAVNPRYRVVGNHAIGEYFLQITNVQTSDEGLYQCIIIPNGRAVTLAANLEVNILQTPNQETPLCSSSPSPDLVYVGDEVTIFCSSPGGVPPTRLTWLENGHAIAGPSSVHMLSHTFTLEEQHNGRTFTCRSTHPSFHGERFCSVVPFQKNPQTRIEPPLFLGEVGGTAMFQCVAAGFPPELEYTWLFNGHPVNILDRRFAITDDGRSFIISDLTEEDNGIYVRCQISAVNGPSASSSARLLIFQGTEEPPTVTTVARTTVNTTKPYFNQSTEVPTELQTLELGGIGTGKSSSVITVIIVAAIVISQVVFISLVYGIHRIANRMKKSGQPSSLETGMPTTNGRNADSCEIAQIHSKVAQPSGIDDHRYKSLHRYDTANSVALALSDKETQRNSNIHQTQVDSYNNSSNMEDSVYHKVPSLSLDYEIPKDRNNAAVEEYVLMRPSVTSETLDIQSVYSKY
ncbi:Cell adhesion molecule 2 [Holothuria leucospilota]|uniref:Cell adhesion molecule 2 n=1 Tax=Holothuria leucospilota TaxID=206669 RepID=A0A9Q1H1Z5_HOLLE|nr:Cell adhesion molecule 2 [Holothuria leucospilota]